MAEGGYLTAGAVRVWFLNKRKVLASWEEPTGVSSVHISPSGRLVASQNFGDKGRVKIRSVESRKDVLEIDAGDEWVRVRFSPDGETLATASQDGELKLWNVDDGKELKSLASLSFRLQCLAFSRDGKRIVAGGGTHERTRESESSTPESPVPEDFGWVGIWEIASGNQIAEMKDMPGLVLGIAISPNGKLVATADIDAVARLWEAETGKLVFPLSGHEATLAWVDFSPDGKMLASCGYDRTAKIWSVESGQEEATLSDHDGDVLTTRFSPDGKTLVTAGSEGLVRLWDTQTWKETDVLHPEWSEGDAPEPVLAVAYAPGAELVASAHGDKTVRLRDPSTGRMVRLLEGNDSHVSSIAFSPDGRVLATAGSDKHVKLWDVDRGRELKRLVGHTAEVHCAAFSPDAKGLASGGSDRTIRLWDVVSGDQRAKLEGHSATVRSVAYSADGKRLASGSDDSAVKIWNTG
ncbi:WD40 repeat domain-containing protein, partial [Planctomycetota bacterium]